MRSTLVIVSAGLLSLSLRAELSPTLEVLPLNSTLSNVTIPRYDQNQNRVAYLKADLMEILADGDPVNGRQPIMVDCTGIQLRMSTEDDVGDISVDMEHARYRMTPGVLTVQETITAKSPQFQVTGNGGVFHLDSQRGFLFGPLDCAIFPKATAHHPTMITPIHALFAATNLITFNPGHNPPTTEELLKVESLTKSSQSQVQSNQNQTAQSVQEQEAESKRADQELLNFAKDVDSKSLNLLIQNPPAANPAVQAKPPLEKPDFTIHSDGGCFFDGNENLLVFLRNIVVKEARFTLKAQEELKVFFNAAEPEKEGAEKDKKGSSPKANITDIKSLVATGGVNFSGIDKDGNPVEASAATAYYSDKDQTLILKDGDLTFWTKQGNRELQFRAEKENSSIRIELSGDSMTAHTSGDGWAFGALDLAPKEN